VGSHGSVDRSVGGFDGRGEENGMIVPEHVSYLIANGRIEIGCFAVEFNVPDVEVVLRSNTVQNSAAPCPVLLLAVVVHVTVQ
jgi:hypothetical protein